MKLYVWEYFCPDWSSGLAFAIAPNLEKAIKAVENYQKTTYDKERWGPHKVYTLDRKSAIAFAVSGGS